jgi:hypothetical protein
MTRGKKAKPINLTIFFIYILLLYDAPVTCRPARKENLLIRFYQFEFGLISANSEKDRQNSQPPRFSRLSS